MEEVKHYLLNKADMWYFEILQLEKKSKNVSYNLQCSRDLDSSFIQIQIIFKQKFKKYFNETKSHWKILIFGFRINS